MLKTEEIGTDLSMHLYRVFAKSFKSVNEHAVTGSKIQGFNPTAFAVLEVLYYKGSQPIQQIGAKLLLQSGNVTYVIDKLETAGLLHRTPCPRDRRVIYAELTSKGQALMDQLYPEFANRIDYALSGLNDEEKHIMIDLLKKMGREAEKLAPLARKG
ncbi:MarR family transcriptional regulator [Paenibacillus macerans]|uniref:MarR family protein n=1 Tax=Paenibacillus macerans TaxID=44252 RepID=A0A090ZQU4_PAEMA|nr:MarR family transcriptional regulator [Paenibacillus macerans]KFN06506.1 marR family protein [Paenibacillus macerans]MBS5909079.1 MarR family transcriptional regulator [Paenibacillus macerans]MCY7560539.1 MarR family transcriptional regulator [Paenibacillus macerans]MDU5946352.1 MarR family transcriptional regulator [Paenibacillus macerans]MEC0140714.1 MarR family transcriptional regulator [Paenibacillus macerans]